MKVGETVNYKGVSIRRRKRWEFHVTALCLTYTSLAAATDAIEALLPNVIFLRKLLDTAKASHPDALGGDIGVFIENIIMEALEDHNDCECDNDVDHRKHLRDVAVEHLRQCAGVLDCVANALQDMEIG